VEAKPLIVPKPIMGALPLSGPVTPVNGWNGKTDCVVEVGLVTMVGSTP
jgi:hypothetical protein